jgi:hypothetical protein
MSAYAIAIAIALIIDCKNYVLFHPGRFYEAGSAHVNSETFLSDLTCDAMRAGKSVTVFPDD